MSTLVVFGGTFDPFHLGHAYLATRAAAAFRGQVCVLPNGNPPHRDTPTAPWQERLTMCRLALTHLKNVNVSAQESPQQPRPTVTTLQQLKRQQPKSTLLLLIGADSYHTFAQWKQPEQILRLAHLLVVPRAASPLPRPLPWGRKMPHKAALANGSGGVYVWRCRPPAVSARQCRHAIAAGMDTHTLLSPAVAEFIRTRGLYQSASSRL